MKLVRLFFTNKQIGDIKFFKDPKKRDPTIFLLFLIPGTPKDVLTYLTGLFPVHLGRYLLITTIARIPSVLSSTLGGSMLGQQEYKLAVLVFGVTLALTLAATLVYRLHQNKLAKAAPGGAPAAPITAEDTDKKDQKDVPA